MQPYSRNWLIIHIIKPFPEGTYLLWPGEPKQFELIPCSRMLDDMTGGSVEARISNGMVTCSEPNAYPFGHPAYALN